MTKRLRFWLGRPEFSPVGLISILIWVLVVFFAGRESALYGQFLVATCLLFILPGYFLARRSGVIRIWHSHWERLVLALVLGASILLLIVFPISYFGVPIPGVALWSYGLVLSAFGLRLLYQDLRRGFQSLKNLEPRHFRWEDWIAAVAVWLVFCALLYIHIVPTKRLPVAPLHDPAQNSLMAQRLIEHFLLHASLPKFSNWYPPGASYLAALIGSITNLSGAKIVLIQTNFFNMMIAFSIALLAKRILVDRRAGWIAACAYGLNSYSAASYYFLAGKNSQVISDFWFFCAIYFLIGELWRKDARRIMITIAVVGATVMMHVTQAPILGCMIFLVAIWRGTHFGWRPMWPWLRRNFIVLAVGILAVGLSVAIEFYVFSSDNLGGRLTEQAINTASNEVTHGFGYFWSELIRDMTAHLNLGFLAEAHISQIMALLGLIGAGYWTCSRQRYSRPWVLIIYFLIFSIFMFYVLIFRFTGILLTLAIMLAAVMGYFAIWRILRQWRWGILILLVGLFVPGVGNLKERYQKYRGAAAAVSVSSDDRAAFQWIIAHTPPDAAFFTPDISNTNLLKTENITIGGVLYLKHFTGREDVLGFVGGDRFSHEEVEYRGLLFKLQKNYRDMEILHNLTKNDIDYIYAVAGARDAGFQANPDLYQPVFSEGRVIIYKIKTDEN